MATYTNAQKAAYYVRVAKQMERAGRLAEGQKAFDRAAYFANRTGVKNVKGRMPPSRRRW